MRPLSVLIAVISLVAASVAVPSSALGQQTGMSREQIKSMPITERPNRPIHFYGNTVRFIHRIRTGR